MADRVRCGDATHTAPLPAPRYPAPDRPCPSCGADRPRSIDASLGLWRDALALDLETVMDIPGDGSGSPSSGWGSRRSSSSSRPTTRPASPASSRARARASITCVLRGPEPGSRQRCVRLEIGVGSDVDSARVAAPKGLPPSFSTPGRVKAASWSTRLIEAPGGAGWPWASSGFLTVRRAWCGYVSQRDHSQRQEPPGRPEGNLDLRIAFWFRRRVDRCPKTPLGRRCLGIIRYGRWRLRHSVNHSRGVSASIAI